MSVFSSLQTVSGWATAKHYLSGFGFFVPPFLPCLLKHSHWRCPPPYICGIPACLGILVPSVPASSTCSMCLFVLPLLLMLFCGFLFVALIVPSPILPLFPLLLYVHRPLLCVNYLFHAPSGCMSYFLSLDLPSSFHALSSLLNFMCQHHPLPSTSSKTSRVPPVEDL